MTGVLPSWQIVAWSPVRMEVNAWEASTQKMRYRSVSVDQDMDGRLYGQVLWAAEEAGVRLGIAWDWKEARSGVATLLDPMSVLSNVELVDSAGRTLAENERLLYVNGSVYTLPWQLQVYNFD